MAEYEEEDKRIEEKEKQDTDPEVRYAFITFGHMDAVEYIERAYNVGWLERHLAMSCFGRCCCPSK